MASKKTKVVGVRLPLDVIKEMKNANLTGKEAIQIALNTKKSPEKLYKAQLRKLLSENEYHASMIALNNTTITELKNKIGFEGTLEELEKEVMMSETDEAIQTTLDRYESIKGSTKLPIMDFITSKRGEQIIEIQLAKTDLTKEDFIDLLIEKHDKSIQTKLDS